jgi:hypothetical protein
MLKKRKPNYLMKNSQSEIHEHLDVCSVGKNALAFLTLFWAFLTLFLAFLTLFLAFLTLLLAFLTFFRSFLTFFLAFLKASQAGPVFKNGDIYNENLTNQVQKLNRLHSILAL